MTAQRATRYSESDVAAVVAYRHLQHEDDGSGRDPFPLYSQWEIEQQERGRDPMLPSAEEMRAAVAVADAQWRRGKALSAEAILLRSERSQVPAILSEYQRELAGRADSPAIIFPAGYVAMNQQYIVHALGAR